MANTNQEMYEQAVDLVAKHLHTKCERLNVRNYEAAKHYSAIALGAAQMAAMLTGKRTEDVIEDARKRAFVTYGDQHF